MCIGGAIWEFCQKINLKIFGGDDKKEVFNDKLELQKELKEEREAELAKQIASNKIDPNNIEEVNKFLHETAIKQDFLQKDPLFFEKLEWLTPKIEEAIETGELIAFQGAKRVH